jgi:hypothetical protein
MQQRVLMSVRKRALLAGALGLAICNVYACSGAQNGQAPSDNAPPAGGASEGPSGGDREASPPEPSQPIAAPHGKRAPCSSDQSCNENPAVSALWGRCTEMGICECNPGFERSPTSDLCRPAQ